MSKNNIYVEYSDDVKARYKKTTIGAVAGTRHDPTRNGERVSFILESDGSRYNIEKGTLQFDYSTDVIELYTEREASAFKRLNAYLFKEGLLEPYYEDAPVLEDNTLTETEIAALANIKNTVQFKAAVDKVTSAPNLLRIKDMTRILEKPLTHTEYVEQRYATISNT